MKNFFHANIKDKHDFVLYNKEDGKWYERTLSPITLQPINSGMGFKKLYKDEASYAEAKAIAFKAEQENRNIINYREHFTSALYESTSEVFKPLTNNQDKSLKEEQNIVNEISDLSKSLKAMKEEPNEEKKIEKDEKKEQEEQEEKELKEEHKETLSKNECMDLINSDDNMDELFKITEYKDNKIRFHIFDNLQCFNLIENGSDHNIELIEEDSNVIIKASRIENKQVKKYFISCNKRINECID